VVVVSNRTNLKKMVKSKAIPLQVWTDPVDSGRLKLPDFKTVGIRRW